jgi:putative nucleotidyltransferase with HDIG domain
MKEEHAAASPEKNIFLVKQAINILKGMHMAFKNMKIYEPNNRLVRDQIDAVFQVIQNLYKTENEIAFAIRQSTLFLNGTKVHFTFSNYYLFRFLSEELTKRDISVLRFHPGIKEEELSEFVLFLAKKVKETKNPYKNFLTNLKEHNITHIDIEKVQPHDESRLSERDTTKIFFLGITHLKEMFEMLKQEERIPLTTTRRLMQSIFNHIVNNEYFAYGLTTIKNFDEYTLNHSINVCILSISLGRKLGLDRNELAELGISAFFHDFGKTEIPKEILTKPGKLDEKERDIIEKHPYLGAEKLIQLRETSRLPLRAVNVAMEHHVKEDLSGYPKYQKKRHVNLYSKIVKICDFYDALTTKRPYRKRVFTRDETLGMMMEKSGIEFDAILLKVFSAMMGTYPVGTLVLLNTGEIGIVFETNPEPSLLLRPKVKIITDSNGNKKDGELVDLSEKDPLKNTYKKSIVKTLDPHRYNIPVSDYFLLRAQSTIS